MTTTVFERRGLPTAVLDVREAAAYLAIKERNLYGLVRAGEIPHVRVGRSIRFKVEDLDGYIETRRSTTWEKVDQRGRPSTKQ